MSTLVQDLRFAVRSLKRHPLFTAIGIVTLALGIGLNSAVFSAIEAMLLRPLGGVRAPNEIVQLYRRWPGGEFYGSSSLPHYRDIRDRATDVFSGVGAWCFAQMNLSFGGRNEAVMGVAVSAMTFPTLGIEMERGRGFSADEESGRNAHRVVVLGHSLWQRSFGGDPSIVGKQVIINGHGYTVVGIASRNFSGMMPMISPAMYVPLTQASDIAPSRGDIENERGQNFLNVVARLRPGVSVEQAKARLEVINNELAQTYPDNYRNTGVYVIPQADAGVHPMFRQTQVQMSALVMAVVAMLLLIACVNVANLFLARASERSREMAVRLSIGAERSRLIRQLLTESTLFAVVAGVVGLLVAWWAIGIANGIRLPIDIDVRPDLRLSFPVLAFSFVLSLAVGVLFGLAPALQSTRPALIPALKGEAPAGGSRSKLSTPLVVAQVALSLILLTCAGLFLRNIRMATTIDKGFAAENLLFANVDPTLQGYAGARTTQFYDRLLERLRTTPGVSGASLIDNLPLGLSNSDSRATPEGYTPAPDENMSIPYALVSEGYFETMKIPLVKGRTFTTGDDSAAAPALIVNERFVERFFKGRDPIGARVRAYGDERTIVGVTTTGKYKSLGEPPTAYMYIPMRQVTPQGMSIAIRTAADPSLLLPTLRTEVAALDPEIPLSNIATIDRHLGTALLPSRIAGTALGVFGILGLLLAAVGVYGVMSYSVAQRTREIGIRMAIGSSAHEVVGLVVKQGMKLVGMGLAIGLAGAIGVAQLVRGLLYGGSATDPATIAVVAATLTAVAFLAVWIPARRASAVDPIKALRAE